LREANHFVPPPTPHLAPNESAAPAPSQPAPAEKN
jgi:hypothetical protein